MDFAWPATGGFTVTPSDSAKLPKDARALYIGVTGNLVVRTTNNDDLLTFANVPVGIFPVQCRWVLATGTTATGIVALL